MDNGAYSKIKDAISKHDVIGIVVGKDPNLDEMGAALSLYLGLLGSNKKVSVACVSQPIVEISSLVGIDKVKAHLEGEGGDLIVSFPFKENQNEKGEMESEIQKVSYTIENGFLNIVVKAGEKGLSFDAKDVQYRKAGAYPTLLFVVGTPRLSNLGNLFNPTLLKDTLVVNIDNKTDNQGFGDIVLVSPRYSSVSEQIGDFLVRTGFPIDVDIAQNLLSGISFGTDNFQKPHTTSLAFELAALFIKKGAVRSVASHVRSQINRGTQPGKFAQPADPFSAIDDIDNFDMPQPASNPEEEKTKDKSDKNPPTDWLMPKVFRGSTNLS